MQEPHTDDDLYAHLIDLGLTPRAAASIGADLYDLAQGIAKIGVKLVAMDAVPSRAIQEMRWEIELHLRQHLTSLNAELRSLQRRTRPTGCSSRF